MKVKLNNIPTYTPSPIIHPIEYTEDDIDTSDVNQNDSITTTSVLQQRSNLPKNLRSQNQVPHKYHLRSKTSHIIPNDSAAHHIFSITPAANHIYRSDGKKEIIDSLLQGDKAHI